MSNFHIREGHMELFGKVLGGLIAKIKSSDVAKVLYFPNLNFKI